MPRKKKKKKLVCTLDAETDPFKAGRVPLPFCWGLYMGDGNYHYWWGDDCTQQLLDFLYWFVVDEKQELIIYAHNGGKFDYFYLLDHLEKDLKIINGRISKAYLFNGGVELRDSYNILPLPLSSFKKDDTDYSTFERDKRERHKQDILNYLQSDCVYLYEWITEFENRFGRNLTLAGATFKQVKNSGYEVQNTYDEYDTLFRQFYYGGRVQCFEVGEFIEDLIYIDINSAYPRAMMERHPHGGQYIVGDKIPTNGKPYFARIKAKSQGALPCKGKDKLVFPCDNIEREYFATSWEIEAGLETNTLEITEVLETYRFVLYEDFQAHVKFWYAEKLEAKKAGDKTREQFAKLMLNAAYGKFGQDGRKFEDFCIMEYGEWPDNEEGKEKWSPYSTIETIKDYQLFSRPAPSHRFYNVATAASITGYVRAFMWRSLCASEKPLYCDTDSIICAKFHGDIGDELGQWKIEGELQKAYIAQKKMYAVELKNGEWKKACKGVNLTAEQIVQGVKTGESITTYRDAPNFSLKGVGAEYVESNPVFSSLGDDDFQLKYAARFIGRKTDFENIQKNTCTNPDI